MWPHRDVIYNGIIKLGEDFAHIFAPMSVLGTVVGTCVRTPERLSGTSIFSCLLQCQLRMYVFKLY